MNGVADVMALRNAVLQRNAALRDVTSVPTPNALRGPDNTAPPSSFAATMQTALQQVNALQEQEDVATEAYERGETTDIATVAVIRARASVSLEATLQVRNKVLAAYKDIMNMPV